MQRRKVIKGYVKIDFREYYITGKFPCYKMNLYAYWNNLMFILYKLNKTIVTYEK